MPFDIVWGFSHLFLVVFPMSAQPLTLILFVVASFSGFLRLASSMSFAIVWGFLHFFLVVCLYLLRVAPCYFFCSFCLGVTGLLRFFLIRSSQSSSGCPGWFLCQVQPALSLRLSHNRRVRFLRPDAVYAIEPIRRVTGNTSEESVRTVDSELRSRLRLGLMDLVFIQLYRQCREARATVTH